ncbi:unnamed protein product [Rhizophagus irregularis]|nr:unnamed protein product [Rhizophagus irregularis]
MSDDPKKASKIIDKYLRERNFVVSDFTKPIDDPLAIRLVLSQYVSINIFEFNSPNYQTFNIFIVEISKQREIAV